MKKLPNSITVLLVQLRGEIKKNYNYEDIPDAVYAAVIFLARGFGTPENQNLARLIFEKLWNKFSSR